MNGFYLWLAGISLLSLILTAYDKAAAKKRPKHRVPEKTLFLFAALGGSLAMLMTMLLIRHKTKHKRFMLGLPAILLAQLLLGFLLAKVYHISLI